MWILPIQEVDPLEWDVVVESSPAAWFWHLHATQHTLAAWPHKSPCGMAVVEGDRVVGILPLHLYRIRVPAGIRFGWLESMGGFAFLPGLEEDDRATAGRLVRARLKEIARRNRCFRIEIRRSPVTERSVRLSEGTFSPLLEDSFALSGHSWMIDLRVGEQQIWARMKGRARTAIRKSEKAGIKVRRAAAGEEDLDNYYLLHSETYKRTGATPHPKEYFKRIWDNHVARGTSVVWLAELPGSPRPVAAANVAVYKNAAMYWTGASNSDGLRSEANSALQWAAIRWMVENGVELYDVGEGFITAVGKQKGLNEFKRSFGGELVRQDREVAEVGGLFMRQLRQAKGALSHLRDRFS